MPTPIFDPEQHRYTTPDGQVLPSVTAILSEYTKVWLNGQEFYVAMSGDTIPSFVMDRAAQYGAAVHKILELSLLHGVGSFTCPPELEAAAEQVAQFIRQYEPEVVMVEQPLYSEKMMVAGTPDLFFRSPRIHRGKRLCELDAKTGVGLMTGPQTAAYEAIYREHIGEKGLIDRYKLQLPKNGGQFRFEPLTNQDDIKYFNYRRFCLQYQAQLQGAK